MAALPLALALSLAAQAAPNVQPDTLVTFAQQESGLNALALHDNDTGESFAPPTRERAERIAYILIARLGHSVDVGLMQVNSANLRSRGVTIREALDPATSMRVGGAILSEAYLTCRGDDARTAPQQAVALRCAAARYNAGRENPAGRAYAARIWRTAATVVPSIGKIMADFPEAASGIATADARPSTTTANAPEPAPPPASVFVKPAAARELTFSPKP